jgi:hypothetical protein
MEDSRRTYESATERLVVFLEQVTNSYSMQGILTERDGSVSTIQGVLTKRLTILSLPLNRVYREIG